MNQFLKDYYPTPDALIERLVEGLKLDGRSHILEPSAGTGHIAEFVRKRFSEHRTDPTIDVIEINDDFQKVLNGKGFRVIHDDFLTFRTLKRYNLIVANFPFSDGQAHLQRAVELIKTNGGELRCLVNAETIRNPCDLFRQALVKDLKELDAEIEYLQGEFENSERKTSVEVALIKCRVEKEHKFSRILDGLKKETMPKANVNDPQGLVVDDFAAQIVSQFNFEAKAGVRLIEEYFALKPHIKSAIVREGQPDYSSPLIKIEVGNAYESPQNFVNEYIKGVRRKFWQVFINNPKFSGVFTSEIMDSLYRKLDEMSEYDFSVFNINKLYDDLQAQLMNGIEASILKMFDEFSAAFSYGETFGTNCHYYNGWKTNKAHKINYKIILPIDGFSAYGNKRKLDSFYIEKRLVDIIKVFNYLSDDDVNAFRLVGNTLDWVNRQAEVEPQSFRNIDFRYFETTFYKKGTCHIKFLDERLIDKLNILGSQKRGWLPPCYGKVAYEEMSDEDKTVVDDFQGKEKYAEVFKDREFYLMDFAQARQLKAMDDAAF